MKSRRTTVLAALRRQADRLGRVVVALFAVASLTIAGAPCLAMVSAGVAPEQRAAAPTHEHGHHGGHAGDHSSTHPAAHDDGSAQKPAPHCPHCPLAGAMPGHVPSSAHSFCSAADDLADQTSFVASPFLAKHILLVATFETPPPLIYRPPPTGWHRPLDFRGSAIALNLRNCVFLI
jgi:hypothetical protein